MWGRREIYEGDRLTGGKYNWLWQNDARTTAWQELKPVEPYFFFVPKDFDLQKEYEGAFSLREAFVVSGNAIKTERDGLSIHFTEDGIRKVVDDFRKLPEADLRVKYDQPVDSRDWQVLKAKTDVTTNKDESFFQCILYRPFDVRHTWYSGQSRGFIGTPGYPVMRNMLGGGNLALTCLRQSRRGETGALFVSDCLIGKDLVSPYDIGTAFPLYLYPSADELDASTGRRPNINPIFIAEMEKRLGLSFDGGKGVPPVPASHGQVACATTFTPEDIFHYAYAVFHSPTYRTRYAEFLKIDFPRLPLTSNRDLFFRLAVLGGELVGLHIMESPKLNDLMTEFPEKGTDAVEKVSFTPEDGRDGARPSKGTGRVWINSTQYFGGVPAVVWNFHVGGYQVCGKWLKDRKGRTLTYEDIQHYQKIVVALNETIRLMTGIDQAIEAQGGWPGAFSGA